MPKKSKRAFWIIYLVFCVVTTVAIGAQGAFDNIGFAGSMIVLAMYLVCGYFIDLYIRKNPDVLEKWFD